MATEGKIINKDDHSGKDKEQQKNNNTVISAQNLDELILFNILTRIPADILQNNFKYQCRQWRHLLSYQDFINTNICQSKPGIIYMEQIGDSSESRFLLQYMEFSGLEILQVRTLHDFKTDLTIKSSCNGLLLMEENRSLYHIINPVTKKHIAFPAMRTNDWCELVFHGEYKVVELFHLHELERYAQCLRITTFNSDLYTKHIKIPENYVEEYKYSHVYINGVFYWIVRYHANVVVSFDLDTEAFHIMQSPVLCTHYGVDLINILGSLSVVEHDFNRSHDISVWSLEGEKWEKAFALNDYADFVGFLDHTNLFIYANLHFKFGAYDVKKKQHCLVDDSKHPISEKHWWFDHKVHVNTLLSLNGMV